MRPSCLVLCYDAHFDIMMYFLIFKTDNQVMGVQGFLLLTTNPNIIQDRCARAYIIKHIKLQWYIKNIVNTSDNCPSIITDNMHMKMVIF